MKPTIIILTTKFGTNFSGGATSTCEIFHRIQDQFEKIIVIGTQLGEHSISNIEFRKTSSFLQMYRAIRQFDPNQHLFYGDFYNSVLLALANVRFVFTYHDNWPELGKLDLNHWFQSQFYSTVYQYIFRKALRVVTVSQFKKNYLKQYSSSVSVIPNGFYRKFGHSSVREADGTGRVLMVGNIDSRKYKLAVKLFEMVDPSMEFSIEIYGHIIDSTIARRLTEFQFVTLKGFVKEVPYESYDLLLHTSFTESFGLVICEAIFHQVPVLAFDCGGARELINPKNGRLIHAYNLELMLGELENLIKSPMKADPGTVQQYAWASTSEAYKNLLKDVA